VHWITKKSNASIAEGRTYDERGTGWLYPQAKVPAGVFASWCTTPTCNEKRFFVIDAGHDRNVVDI